jgi:L-rhamnose isomerase
VPKIDEAYALASQRYKELDVDTEAALSKLKSIPISLHCWQGDDVTGFEAPDARLSGGGILATGNYPGKARNPQQLRQDLDLALSLIPGLQRLNLHAIYGEFDGQKVDRDQIEPKHFQGWISWAKSKGIGMDFNPSFFSHPKANDGYTLAHADDKIRAFWVEHGKRCRAIGAEMGKQLGSPCVTNIWIPDGSKDSPADRQGPRQRLRASLDAMLEKPFDKKHLVDAVECKLFGIGSESYVVGSHEFYMGYAVQKQIALCLDAGHFHPTEVISDKLSSAAEFVPEILLHVSRGIRWDSDHVVTLTDELQSIAFELVRGRLLERIHIGLDYFDATINRVAAWVIGTRNMQKALLIALLEPSAQQRAAESSGNLTRRLALMEAAKALPWGAVWDQHCRRGSVPGEFEWMQAVETYEKDVQFKR